MCASIIKKSLKISFYLKKIIMVLPTSLHHRRGSTQFNVYLDIQSFSIHTDHKDIVLLSNFKHQIADLCAGDNNNRLLNNITKRVRKTQHHIMYHGHRTHQLNKLKGLKIHHRQQKRTYVFAEKSCKQHVNNCQAHVSDWMW